MKETTKCPVCGGPVSHSTGRVYCKGFPIRCLYSENFEEMNKDFEELFYVVYDVETTGRSTKTEFITEIGATLMKGSKNLETFSSLIKPKKAIPQNIVALTGITNEMVYDAKDFVSVFEEFKLWIDEKTSEYGEIKLDYMFAHNATFDYNITLEELKRNGLVYEWPFVVDTLKVARKAISRDDISGHSQPVLAEHFGISYDEDGAHRASSDTDVLAQVIQRLVPLLPENYSFRDYGIKAQKKEGRLL